MRISFSSLVPLAILLLAPSMACTQQPDPVPPVRSFLAGTVTVNSSVDSTGDYSGIEIIVTNGVEDGPDTLGYAVTQEDGSFSTDVIAQETGVYPLVMKRRSTVLSVSEFVVASGDSARLTAELPLGQRVPIVRSAENSAWLAFKNADAQHNTRLVEMLKDGRNSQEALGSAIQLAAEVLWSIRNSFPGTMAASVASAKSIVMLDGWNDSLLVARHAMLDPTQPGFLESTQVAGRAQARMHGLDEGISLLRSTRKATTETDIKAAIQKEVAQAYLLEREGEMARLALDSLLQNYPDTEWTEWAERAKYEIDNLFPGKPAPQFRLSGKDGGLVDIDSLRGRPVVIEFWSPQDRQHPAQLAPVSSLIRNYPNVLWVSIGLEADDDLYDAFFEGRYVPGIQVRDEGPKMEDVIIRYNIESVPTRYLVGPDGVIVDKYVGPSLARLASDVQALSESEK